VKDGYVVTNPILNNLGIQTGDKLVAVNGEPLNTVLDVRKSIIKAEVLTIESGNEVKDITLPEDFLGQLSDSEDKSFFGLRYPFVVASVVDSSLNKSANIKEGDIITAINGEPLKYFDQVKDRLEPLKNSTVNATILREGNTLDVPLQVNENGKLGIEAGGTLDDLETLGYYDIIKKEYGFFESWGVGMDKFVGQISGYWDQLRKIFTPSTGAIKGLGGFKAIYSIFPDTWSWQEFWGLTAFLSIMLGVLNLLPIPALDGGHVMFLMYEIVSGRKPSEKFLERAQMVGFFILIALVLFANINDWI